MIEKILDYLRKNVNDNYKFIIDIKYKGKYLITIGNDYRIYLDENDNFVKIRVYSYINDIILTKELLIKNLKILKDLKEEYFID